ncbi:nucleotide-binding protein [Chryseobacterium sp. ISL-6]|uniref:TIR domain-containing protein n=1 Tax=Chryseobacterium sp. ISL-6 TaxID=2819143 RepID=UPI001BE93E06|nr:nucleotide-binding protein [Chryseobacterium sp. ISL-6]MBT2620844.1 nucleotide-binding protein [Chryseobacterium sp. ISL-6]
MIIKELQILTEALWESVKNDLDFFSSISSFVKKMAEFNYSDLTKNDLLEISIYINNIENFFSKYRSSGGSSSLYIPPQQTSTNDSTVKRIGIIVKSLDQMSEQELEVQINDLKPKKVTEKSKKRKKVFIGHGRSKLWARVQLFLKDDLNIESFTFESENQTSNSIIQILEDFLENSSFAILILTAEDETLEGKLRARQNVIHECGLFQGRLGFENVVLLKQTETEDLSNLAGLQYIPFNGENIEQTFYELQRKLKKSGLIS